MSPSSPSFRHAPIAAGILLRAFTETYKGGKDIGPQSLRSACHQHHDPSS